MTTRKNASAENNGNQPQPSGQVMPLFYQKPTLLEAGAHKNMGIAKNINFDFASQVNALPINLVEFPQVAHFYPIAFARDSAATPVAITGVRDNENLFVNEKGEWQQHAYVPAYVRRYPFILSESPDGNQLSLCVDDAPGILDAGASDKIFDADGKPTTLAQNAMEFCRSYHLAAKQTADFAKAISDAGLLVDRSAELQVKNGQRVSFSGFRIVDEAKFNQLPEKVLVEWRAKGWLAGVYAHLFSGLHWGTITRMVNERVPETKAAKGN